MKYLQCLPSLVRTFKLLTFHVCVFLTYLIYVVRQQTYNQLTRVPFSMKNNFAKLEHANEYQYVIHTMYGMILSNVSCISFLHIYQPHLPQKSDPVHPGEAWWAIQMVSQNSFWFIRFQQKFLCYENPYSILSQIYICSMQLQVCYIYTKRVYICNVSYICQIYTGVQYFDDSAH